MLALALHDQAFKSTSLKTAKEILSLQIPERKRSLELQWKESMKGVLIFRQPEHGIGSSKTWPLRACTSSKYLQRLGLATGFKENLTHYYIRRGTGNAVDGTDIHFTSFSLDVVNTGIDIATTAERDQVMGHSHSGIFQFYLNQKVKCDVQAAFLGVPSQDTLLRTVGHMSYTMDPNAPTELTEEDKARVSNHPKVAQNKQKLATLEGRITNLRRRRHTTEELADLYAERTRLDADLNRRKTRMRVRLLQMR